LFFLSGKSVEEYHPLTLKNAKISEISSITAVYALIISLHDNLKKQQITKNYLKTVYNLDEMPTEKGSSAAYCNPDTYTFSYLGILFGDKKFDATKHAKWWQKFWDTSHNQLVWNIGSGIYEITK